MELDDAYANAAHIPSADAYPEKWANAAAAYRTASRCECDLVYGNSLRQRVDLFHPDRLAILVASCRRTCCAWMGGCHAIL